MNTGPYSDLHVREFINSEFIPLKSQCFWDKRTDLMKQYRIIWTPTFVIHDTEGKEQERFVGYVPSDDLLAHLKLGKGKIAFNHNRHAEATEEFSRVFKDHPAAGPAPEAVFYRGVAEYRKGHDAASLRRIYDALSAQYPESEWARRARPYAAIDL